MYIRFPRLVFSMTLFISFSVVSQGQERKLAEIARERQRINSIQVEKARLYALQHKIPMAFTDPDGNNLYLVGVDEFGLPIYRTTLNAGASITTSVDKVKSTGTLGLNLEGEGITVGVWDESLVKDHAEFGSRVVSRQGNKLSVHATHVTGTILAAGIQTSAKGMASRASATTWDFDNDEAEIASLVKPDQTGLLFSNHSYGIVMGFYKDDQGEWKWAGNASISSLEDYRFGFYSSRSRALDEIAFNAPYYTIVWAGGNDRSNTGDGSHPPDGGATGYDCLGPDGVSKNIITVGAVDKVTNYTGPSSVVMSNFSSWGPTDDGRIKPDLVGAGVLLYSTSVTDAGVDAYGSSSGTSMAAPNVTGSLMLLQELYRDLHGGYVMAAATLKALAIHTTREAGLTPGPDYSYGWGLLDVEAAARVLLRQDQQSVFIFEKTLLNNEVVEFDFVPQANSKITASLVWTDPPGTPVAPVLDPATSMLVNDLDVRIVDDLNNQFFPWVLNPDNPSAAATRGVNSRDNVEKIELDNPAQRKHTIRVSHKGQLANNQQNYSLILTFTPASNLKVPLYWVGDSGNWNDPSRWSFTSGGAPANAVPGINSRVIIDENSFSAPGQTVSLTGDAVCGSITWLTKKASSLSLNNHKLSVDGNFIIASDSLVISTEGQIELTGGVTSQNQLSLNESDLSKAEVIINSANSSTWTLNGDAKVGGITLNQGVLLAKGSTITTTKLMAGSSNDKLLDISDAVVNGLKESMLSSNSFEFITTPGTTISLDNDNPATVTWEGITFNGTLDADSAEAILSGGALINAIVTRGTLTINDNNSFNQFTAHPGSTVNFQNGSIQSLTQSTFFNSSSSARTTLNTIGGGTSLIEFDGHYKLCFDDLDITGVGVAGEVTISAGAGSTLTNAANWSPLNCNDALFANFAYSFNCQGALTKFVDQSEGNITSWQWNFDDLSSLQNSSSEQHPVHIFNNMNTFNVTLTVTDGNQTKSYTRPVTVMENDLPANAVIVTGDKLFSELISNSYQWYKDNELLSDETGRSYQFSGEPGAYFVVISDATCNLPSSTFLVTDVEEYNADHAVKIYPNPVNDQININLPLEMLPAKISLISALGQVVFSSVLTEPHSIIPVVSMTDGLYIVDVSSKTSIRKKIVIRR